ncbi:zinc finger protein 713 [Ceratitis capitata]|uniref:(Mediterranean fruit fly) hypothetical protein n=1 Tax=Ceratitis capitata TaxID=7213 RepID=W8C2Y7_CERCA|nr:zinc finger protein 713 [Ceratitis capitata]CAD7013638.1 unnamed protein product [Ceratitis capitata]
MNICGNVYVSKNVSKFALKCLYCDDDIEDWETFVSHIQSLHNSDLEEPCIDPIGQMDYKEDNALDWLKDEVPIPAVGNGVQWDETPNALKIEIASEEENSKAEAESSKEPDWDNDQDENFEINDSSSDSDSPDESVRKTRKRSAKKVEDSDSDEDSPDGIDTKTKTGLLKTFKPSFYRNNRNTNVFLDMYEKSPCLWNPKDENYNNNSKRAECKEEMIKEMKSKCQIVLSHKKLWECFRALYTLYKTIGEAKENKSEARYKKLSPTILAYYDRCSFLSVAEEGFLDVFDDTPNTVTNLSVATINSTTITFVEAYKRFTSLYDNSHPDYNYASKRRLRYKDMADILRTEQNVEFTEDDIYKGIDYLRHWYYKLKSRLGKTLQYQMLSNAAQFYVEKMSFLPERGNRPKIKCTECDKVFQGNVARRIHLYKEHKIGELPYACTECNRTFSSHAAMSGHKKRNHMEKKFKCEFCDRCYAMQGDLNNHMSSHTGDKPFICELCGKAFRTRTKLRFHNNAIHLKLREFKCTMCTKDFLKKRDLNDHIKAHLNIRDKICDTCGKGFTNSHALLRHKQLHAEVKKFACKFCDKRFYQFVGLNSHMKHRHDIYKNSQKRKPEEIAETSTQMAMIMHPGYNIQ